jgi:hypothetical protein
MSANSPDSGPLSLDELDPGELLSTLGSTGGLDDKTLKVALGRATSARITKDKSGKKKGKAPTTSLPRPRTRGPSPAERAATAESLVRDSSVASAALGDEVASLRESVKALTTSVTQLIKISLDNQARLQKTLDSVLEGLNRQATRSEALIAEGLPSAPMQMEAAFAPPHAPPVRNLPPVTTPSPTTTPTYSAW